MDYDAKFAEAIESLRAEGRYRVFMDIARRSGEWIRGLCFGLGGGMMIVLFLQHLERTTFWQLLRTGKR